MPVETLTFGCRLNGVESESMRVRAEAAGLADALLVNTCAVTAEAARQSGQAVRRAARTHPDRMLIVTGCAAEIEPQRFAAIPGVATLVPNRDKLATATWRSLGQGESGDEVPELRSAPSDASAGRVRAFVQVQTGCDHRCTFCVIPFGRGASRSVPAPEVIRACRGALDAGAREVVLTGVDLTAYGADLDIGPTLGGLVRAILAAIPDLPRLRLSSIDSVEADADLLRALAEEPRLMPHLHLSLQAGDDLVLKRMKRRHSRRDAIAFCREVRRLRPDTVFGADLIAGFPTESEPMFARSLDLVAECGLTYLHVFPYSPRPGTPAARMPAVPGEVVRERAARLRLTGAAALARHLEDQVGGTSRVLVENEGMGRTEGFAPVRFASPAPRGEIVVVTPSGHDGRELLAA